MTPTLQVDGLSCTIPSARGELRTVRDVSLVLEPGQILGLVGESGCGKSTFAKAISGSLPREVHCEGRIRFRGTDLDSLTPRRRRQLRGRHIGVVFQDPMMALNPVVPIGRQIVEVIRHHLPLSRNAATERAIELLTQVGVADARTRLKLYPHQFSGGLRQRITIAAALACDPELLIADEATTALDVTVQRQILELLTELVRARGMAMILVSHDLGVVARHTHDTAVMYAGEIIEQAPTTQLFARPRHRYTEALLESIPRVDRGSTGRLHVIEGAPPDPARLPPGCAFAPRCPAARPDCGQAVPPMAHPITRRHRCVHPASAAAKESR
ncbi:ABC transporter ATP-binding protein [Nocardia sp. NBC_00416]|uniref:ABC transporter ATP-binding protein n=1 Tax=Nocardia sp. NBC_00416 TaxID=2975991 RepID=UPI002E1EA567